MAVIRFLAWDYDRAQGFYSLENPTETEIDRANRGTRTIVGLLNSTATGTAPGALMVSI